MINTDITTINGNIYLLLAIINVVSVLCLPVGRTVCFISG